MSTLSGTTSICRNSTTCALSPTRSRTRGGNFHARSCATSAPSLLAEPPCRPQGLRASPGGELFANHPAEDWAKSSSATSMLDNPRSSHPGNGKRRITRHEQYLLSRTRRTRTPIFSAARRAEFKGEAERASNIVARGDSTQTKTDHMASLFAEKLAPAVLRQPRRSGTGLRHMRPELPPRGRCRARQEACARVSCDLGAGGRKQARASTPRLVPDR